MSNARNIASGAKFVDTAGDTMTGDLTISSTAGQLKLTDTDGTEQNTTIKQSGGNVFIQARDNTNDAGIVFAGNGGGNFTSIMRMNAGGNISVPNQHDVVISKKGCLRAGNADTIVGTAAGSNVTSTTMLGCSHVYNQGFGSGRYMHLKTNHPIGPNSGEYSMILFEYIGYRYSPAATVHTIVGMHPWGTSIYNTSATNNGSIGTFHNNEYASSDNKVVLVIDANTTSHAAYLGFTLNAYITHSGYPNLNPLYYNSDGQLKIIATSLSSNTSGVY